MSAKRVFIVGGVAGGASCAARLRRMDESAEIVMFERGPDVSFANCGLPYYLGGVIEQRDDLLVASPERFRTVFNVDVRVRHEVRAIDPGAKTINVADLATGSTSTESYDVLVLAPGAEPVRPPLPGIDSPGVFTLRSLEDTDAILAAITQREARRAVIIGAGYIGLEMAENLVRRQMSVTVLELLPQVMAPMDPEMVTPAQEELRHHGVDLRLQTPASAIEMGPGGDVLTVQTTAGEHLPADLVILAVGVKPEVHLAEQAGLALGTTGGIKVDDQMRTSDPHIFAVGDAVEVRDFVTGQPTLIPLAGPANRQGRVAADVIAGRDARFRGTQGTAVCGMFGLTLAMTGASEKVLRRNDIAYQKSYTHSPDHASYYPGAEQMAIKLLFDPGDGRVLGAQAVGRAGVEKRIDVIAMAIQKGATVFDLEEAELCYAPQYGNAKDPVNMAGFVAGNILRGDIDVVHWDQWQQVQHHPADEQTPLVLDVRPPENVAAAAVPGTMKIPLGKLREHIAELPRDREIWVHCGIGQASYYANRVLRQCGFQRVKNLSGGITSFKMQP